jgi:hypothetical protein
VHKTLLAGNRTEDVRPELLAFLLGPRIGALIDRDDEQGDGAQDLEELGFCGFHQPASPWKDAERSEQLRLEVCCADISA